MYEIEPIGFFKAEEKEKYSVCRQPSLLKPGVGKIVLNPKSNFEQALEDLEGFSHIFVIYRFHKNHSWKPKVMPPRGKVKRGVFATRAPHRPNFLGLSCLKVIKIEGLNLHVEQHDLLDGTPIFDIKPYLTYADCYPDAKQGWLEKLEEETLFEVECTEDVKTKLQFLKNHWDLDVLANINPRLTLYPYPKKQNRIVKLDDDLFEIAYKSWRVRYSIVLSSNQILLKDIYTGYDRETLNGEKVCPYEDLACHLDFSNQ